MKKSDDISNLEARISTLESEVEERKRLWVEAMEQGGTSRKTNIREEHAARLEFIKNYEESMAEQRKKQKRVKTRREQTANGSTLFGGDDE